MTVFFVNSRPQNCNRWWRNFFCSWISNHFLTTIWGKLCNSYLFRTFTSSGSHLKFLEPGCFPVSPCLMFELQHTYFILLFTQFMYVWLMTYIIMWPIYNDLDLYIGYLPSRMYISNTTILSIISTSSTTKNIIKISTGIVCRKCTIRCLLL